MADFFRVQLGVVCRSDGHSAAKRSAYQSCGRVVDHEGHAFDFSRKSAEHVRTIMLAPDATPEWTRDPEKLWQRAAAAEKRMDAQEARIIDFSLPRAVPAELWEPCIRHVYQPFIRIGMVMQIDIHDTLASDGGRNVNVHGLATLRAIEGDEFSLRKNRTWNDIFRQRNGREVRELFAERLTRFCQGHGIDYEGDARPNAERHRPAPEPNLPRWNFEALKRTGEMPEALAALHEHRRRRRVWEAARSEEVEAALDLATLEAHLRERRRRRLSPAEPAQGQPVRRDRRAAILRAWHHGGWIDADTIPSISAVRFDESRGALWIDLQDGSTLLDRGDYIALRGRLTWSAAMETAAAAERHGWIEVRVHGDQAYKDAASVAAMLRGITVLNHELSPRAQAQLERLLAERAASAGQSQKPQPSQKADDSYESRFRSLNSQEVHRAITKRAFVAEPPPLRYADAETAAFNLKPSSHKICLRRKDAGRLQN